MIPFFVSDKDEIIESESPETSDFSEFYDFRLSNYTGNPNNHNPYSNNGSLYGNVSKQTNVGYRFVQNNNPQRYLEIRNLNITGHFTIIIDVVRSTTNIQLSIDMLGSGNSPISFPNIINGMQQFSVYNVTDANPVHTIRLAKIAGKRNT